MQEVSPSKDRRSETTNDMTCMRTTQMHHGGMPYVNKCAGNGSCSTTYTIRKTMKNWMEERGVASFASLIDEWSRAEKANNKNAGAWRATCASQIEESELN